MGKDCIENTGVGKDRIENTGWGKIVLRIQDGERDGMGLSQEYRKEEK